MCGATTARTEIMDPRDEAIAEAYDALLCWGVDVPSALRQIGEQFDIANLDYIDEVYDQWLK